MKRMIITVLTIAIITAGMAWITHHRKAANRKECLNNLRMLTSPMSCCVPLSLKLKKGDTMRQEDVVQYIKGARLPECPSGGFYIISWIVGGPTPKCSYHGDLLFETEQVLTLDQIDN